MNLNVMTRTPLRPVPTALPRDRADRRRLWAASVLAFVVCQAALRLYWIAGGRWGFTACDRTHLGQQPAGGCGADQVTALPWWPGWCSLGCCAVLLVVLGAAVRRPASSVVATGVWIAAGTLLTAAFPLHLLFEIPAAAAGRPSDWRDLLARLALVVGGALLAGLATSVGPGRQRGVAPYRPVARWTVRWGYAAVALPIVGWALPHALWVLGVPFGISAAELADIRTNLSLAAAVAITAVPPSAALLTLGLIHRWGQRFPRWVPRVGDRVVPPQLAILPAGIVALALVTYGLLSAGVLVRSVADGTRTWSELAQGWAVAATTLVFLSWGVALGVTTLGYHLATRGPQGDQE